MTITVTWYGHAALGLDVGGYHLLVDPFLTGNPAASMKAEDAKADYIFITHGHKDHVGDAAAIARRNDAMIISNDEIANWFAAQGIKKTHGQHLGGGFRYPFGYLKMVYALHGSALPDGSNGGNPGGFLLNTSEGKKIYIAGDTGLFGDMRLIGEEGIDLAVLPIGDNFTMGPDDALRAVRLIAPQHVIPVHYDTYELITQDANSWANRVQSELKTRVHLLKPGESYTLPS